MKIHFKNFYLFSVPVNFDLALIKILFSNHLLVFLENQGHLGIGEGVLYQTPLLQAPALLQKDWTEFWQKDFKNFFQCRQKIAKLFPHQPGLCCAFDMALWDLEAKIKNKSLYQLLGRKQNKKISLIEQIFIPQNQVDLRKKLKQIMAHGTKKIKLKAGRNLQKDLDNISLIKKISRGKIKIQLDLNQALNFNQAIVFGKQIKKMGVVAWEEPLKFQSFYQLKKLKKIINLPIILDESIKNKEQFLGAIKNNVVDILNLKISRLGGITPSLQLIKLAQEYKIGLEIGCSEELGIASQAQLHLAYTINKLKGLEGLGPQRLNFDLISQKPVIRKGQFIPKLSQAGLGVNFKISLLKKANRQKNFPIVSSQVTPLSFYYQYFQQRIKSMFFNGCIFLSHLRKGK